MAAKGEKTTGTPALPGIVQLRSDLSNHIGLARIESERARKAVDLARQQLEEAQRARCFWDDLLVALERGHPAHALLLLRREVELLRRLEHSDEPLAPRLRELRGDLDARARSSAADFGREFPAACREAGLQIDSTSRHPKYSFKEGFIQLEVDDRGLTAKVMPRDGDQIVLGLDTSLVVEKLRAEQVRLFERRTEVQTFLRSLYTAYTAILRAEEGKEGDDIPLRRVTNRMAKNLNRFAADEFNVDLSRLIQSGELIFEGKRVHLNHTRDRRQGMLLHGLESGGYVGFISFKPERQGS